jgi:Family of unknown function (DUF5681)
MTVANPPKGSKKSSDGTYSVGYGRPPEETRFKPGQSGNPKGRSKGSKNFSTHFEEELSQQVTLVENGRRRRMTKRQALAKQLTNKALSNDTKAAALVLDHIRRTEASSAQQPITKSFRQAEDQFVIENILRRVRLAAASAINVPPDHSEEAE